MTSSSRRYRRWHGHVDRLDRLAYWFVVAVVCAAIAFIITTQLGQATPIQGLHL